MKKNLYSLTLSDDVVREVDALAHRMGTNRSALVNQILAEYVSVPTPERRWNDIFEAIEELMTPTVKYEVDLSNGDAQTMGSLNIVFRTQSAALISAMTSFFRLWVQIEDKCLAPLLGSSISCALYDGRFVRPLAMPRGKALTADDVAGAISAYVQLFDRLLKGYLDGSLSASDVEMAYRGDLRSRALLI